VRSPCSCACRENPGTNGGAPRDKASFAKLLTETRAVFVAEARRTKRPRLQLSVAVPSALEYYRASYDVPAISKAVDLCVLTRPDSFSCTVLALIQQFLHQPDGDRGVAFVFVFDCLQAPCALLSNHICTVPASIHSLASVQHHPLMGHHYASGGNGDKSRPLALRKAAYHLSVPNLQLHCSTNLME